MEIVNNPTITLDLKKRRIRIHSTTLRALNDPPYIELLINPDKLTLAVRASKQKHHLAHKIFYDSNRDNELYSDTLLSQLSRIAAGMNRRGSYRIIGVHYPVQNLVMFEMRNMFPVNKSSIKDSINESNK